MRKSHLRLQFLRRCACRKQDGRCFYCLKPMGRDVTAEHLVARMDGGNDTPANIVAACRRCNAARHQEDQTDAPDPATHQTFVLLIAAAGLDLGLRRHGAKKKPAEAG